MSLILLCPNCGSTERDARKLNKGDYMCLTCYTVYDGEVQVYDTNEVELFRNAKRAGAISDPALEGDKEQMKSNRHGW